MRADRTRRRGERGRGLSGWVPRAPGLVGGESLLFKPPNTHHHHHDQPRRLGQSGLRLDSKFADPDAAVAIGVPPPAARAGPGQAAQARGRHRSRSPARQRPERRASGCRPAGRAGAGVARASLGLTRRWPCPRSGCRPRARGQGRAMPAPGPVRRS
jgi:hypothetical protein